MIFTNELELMPRHSEFRGISIGNAIEIFLLMYADDTVLLGDTVLELQRKIRALEEFCEKWSMEVNLTKTKIIVFRNGGVMSKSEKFFYRGKRSSQLHTIGILSLFSRRETCDQKHKKALAGQAEKSLSTVRRMIWKPGHPIHEVAFKIFLWQDYAYFLLWSRTSGDQNHITK